MEVMGLMLGQFVDEYTITCVDVFAMPQVSCFSASFGLLITSLAWNWSKCRGRRSRFPDENVGYVNADRPTRDGCGLVPFSPWLRVLAFRS